MAVLRLAIRHVFGVLLMLTGLGTVPLVFYASGFVHPLLGLPIEVCAGAAARSAWRDSVRAGILMGACSLAIGVELLIFALTVGVGTGAFGALLWSAGGCAPAAAIFACMGFLGLPPGSPADSAAG